MINGLIIVVTIIWGFTWVFMKMALEGGSGPFSFSFFRFALGTFSLMGLLLFLRVSRPMKKDWGNLILLGFFQTTLTYGLIMWGMQYVDAGKSAMILYTMPLWNAILARFFLFESLGSRKVISLIAGILGIIMIMGWDTLYPSDPGILLGELLILLAAVSWAVGNLIIKKKFGHSNSIQVSAWQMLFGSIGLLFLAMLADETWVISWDLNFLFYVMFTGVLASAFCFTIWFWILKRLDSSIASISILLVPVFGVLLSWWLLKEEINVGMIVGSALVLFGVAFQAWPRQGISQGEKKLRRQN
jgi:drug/metabolite transporter (DMT)-like permease